MDLALSNLQRLICHKPQPPTIYQYIVDIYAKKKDCMRLPSIKTYQKDLRVAD